MQSLTLISFKQMPEGLLCHFSQNLTFDEADVLIGLWLKEHGFSYKEKIMGADRLSWRLEIKQNIIWLHFDDLSQSCWFDLASEYLLTKLKQIVEKSLA